MNFFNVAEICCMFPVAACAGAGYVLSREAVRLLVEEALPNKNKCRQDSAGAEDVEMGQ